MLQMRSIIGRAVHLPVAALTSGRADALLHVRSATPSHDDLAVCQL